MELYAGVVFSVFSIGRLLASAFSVMLMNRFGRAHLAQLNYLVVAAVFLAMGVTFYVRNSVAFCILNAVYRFIVGTFIGIGAIALLAITLNKFPDYTAELVMAQSIGFGIGSCIFPAAGALFYHFFGFQGPAYFLAFVFLCSYAAMRVFLRNEEEGLGEKLPQVVICESEEPLQERVVSLCGLLSDKAYTFTSMTMLLVQIKFTYIDPTLAPYYKEEFHVAEEVTGLYFMFLGLGVLVGGLLTPVITSKFLSLRGVLIMGNLTTGATAYLLAPVTHRGTLHSSVFFLYLGAIFD